MTAIAPGQYINPSFSKRTMAAIERGNSYIGQRFGEYTVIGNARTTGTKEKCRGVIVDVRCDCGTDSHVRLNRLLDGTNSCCFKCAHAKRRKYECGDIYGNFWSQLIGSAKIRSLPLEITPNEAWSLFLKQNRNCALSGVDLKFDRRVRTNTTASLDRIEPHLGYIAGNVQWVHKDVNRMKWVLSNSDFIAVCKQVAEYHWEPEDCDPDWGSDE